MKKVIMDSAPAAIVIALISFIVTMVAGWFTHIIYCFQQSEYMLLIAGAIVAPVGSIHGIGLWFGLW